MRRILIATENSPCSHEAVHRFIETIGSSATEVFALTVVAPVSGYHTLAQADAELEEGLMDADRALGDAVLEGARAGITIRTMRRVGEPAPIIVEMARELGVDLIVLGTHGPEALARLAGDSVAEAVLHDAPCGVVIFPWKAEVATPAR